MVAPNLKEKTRKQNQKRKNEIRFQYSFLTVVLLLCLAHIGIHAFKNITKNVNYNSKIKKMAQLKTEAYEENKKLKSELEDFSSTKSLEAIARNNLKMAGEDEVLVIIHRNEDSPPKKDTKKKEKEKKEKSAKS